MSRIQIQQKTESFTDQNVKDAAYSSLMFPKYPQFYVSKA